MVRPSRLDEPHQARFAWDRFRRLMAGMVLAALGATVFGLAVLERTVGLGGNWFLILMSAGGIFATILLAAALMGLVFLSAGTGHDEAVGHDDGPDRPLP